MIETLTVTLIPALFRWSCPTAISGLIVAVVVRPAVQRTPIGALAHVRKEVLEQSPALADRNSATSVALPRRMFGIGATSPHGRPTVISRAQVSSRCVAMIQRRGKAVLSLKASATVGLSASERSTNDNCSPPAGTLADPTQFVARRTSGLGDNRQPPENATDKVLKGTGLAGVYSSWHRSSFSVSMPQAVSAALRLFSAFHFTRNGVPIRG